jgi:hypothetical protein
MHGAPIASTDITWSSPLPQLGVFSEATLRRALWRMVWIWLGRWIALEPIKPERLLAESHPFL